MGELMRVLILEDDAERIAWFRDHLVEPVVVSTAHEAIDRLKREKFDYVFLDYDLGPFMLNTAGAWTEPSGNGVDVARFLPPTPEYRVVIHSQNQHAAKEMASMIPGAKVLPFGSSAFLRVFDDDGIDGFSHEAGE